MTARLTFLGCSDSKGVPRWWCGCAVCTEARTTGTNRRTRPAALVRGAGQTLLLDCGPDLHAQLAPHGPLVPDAVLISHAHNDHLMGLGDLMDYNVYAYHDLPMHGAPAGEPELRPLPIYAPAEVLPQIEDRFQYAFRQRAPVLALAGDGLDLCGFRVRAFRVPHGANGYSYAFRFERPGFNWVYMTDAIDVDGPTADRWLHDLDLLVLGASFMDESGVTLRVGRSVYDVREALALPFARAAGRVVLTHLSHGVDVRAALPDPKFSFAHDGLSVPLG